MALKTIAELNQATAPALSNILHIRQGAEDKYINFEDLFQTVIINNQTDFNSIIERVGANDYKIIDSITNLYLAELSGGYQFSAILSGGDTWGALKTNNCKKIVCENGDTGIDFNAEKSYLEINTTDCYIENLKLFGDGSIVNGLLRSFYLNAAGIKLLNCSVHTRENQTNTHDAFLGNSSYTDMKLTLCKVKNCEANNGDFRGFYAVNNLYGCEVVNTNTTGGSPNIYGFYNCDNLVNCTVDDMDVSASGPTIYGFRDCDSAVNCTVKNIELSYLSPIYGFYNCDKITNCLNYNFDGAGSTINGFYNCNNLSNCITDTITTAGTGGIIGFSGCFFLSSCTADNINQTGTGTAAGFDTCKHIASSKSTAINATGSAARGFKGCSYITSSIAYGTTGVTGDGFFDCDYIDSCSSDNNQNDGYDTCNGIQTSSALNNTVNGFVSCNAVGGCRSTGNGTNYAATVYANWGASAAVGDTAAGGWNG